MKRTFPLLPEVYPDEHAFEIRNFFRERARAGERPLEARKVLFICFTNRCGSNFFSQAIASDGQLPVADEFLCWDVVHKYANEAGLTSIRHYLEWLSRRYESPSGYLVSKLSLSQLIFLYEEGILDEWTGCARFIHIFRRDTIAQAASLNIAWHTKRWTSADIGVEAKVPDDPDELFGIARTIALRNAYFQLIFDLLGITPLCVAYEDFVASPADWTRRVGRFLGLPALTFRPDMVTHQKQAGPLSRSLIEITRSHFRLAVKPGHYHDTDP